MNGQLFKRDDGVGNLKKHGEMVTVEPWNVMWVAIKGDGSIEVLYLYSSLHCHHLLPTISIIHNYHNTTHPPSPKSVADSRRCNWVGDVRFSTRGVRGGRMEVT